MCFCCQCNKILIFPDSFDHVSHYFTGWSFLAQQCAWPILAVLTQQSKHLQHMPTHMTHSLWQCYCKSWRGVTTWLDLTATMAIFTRRSQHRCTRRVTHCMLYIKAEFGVRSFLTFSLVKLIWLWLGQWNISPRRYGENEANWLSGRGLCWHVAVVQHQQDDDIVGDTFIHIFNTCAQDAAAVVACM